MRIFLTILVGLFVLSMSFDSDAGKKMEEPELLEGINFFHQPKVKLIDFPSDSMKDALLSVSLGRKKFLFAKVLPPYSKVKIFGLNNKNIHLIKEIFFTYFKNPHENILQNQQIFHDVVDSAPVPLNLDCQKVDRMDGVDRDNLSIRFISEGRVLLRCEWFSPWE